MICMQKWTSSLKSVVTLKLRKEYLTVVTRNTPVLLWIKYWTVWYIERYSMSTHTGVTNFQKQSGFLAHPVYRLHSLLRHCWLSVRSTKYHFGNLQRFPWKVLWDHQLTKKNLEQPTFALCLNVWRFQHPGTCAPALRPFHLKSIFRGDTQMQYVLLHCCCCRI